MENTSDSQREAWIDRRVQRALRTDHGYLYAQDAEEQAEAEESITRDAERAWERQTGEAA